ncbi:unnamed protein product [marine sediment metagenome]|jgi:hypothetical protein|uniref:Uncharacterized protein n=1 Tax=marine sediment metagenome TaxID=412755 RepID=X1E045_9ZZZZ
MFLFHIAFWTLSAVFAVQLYQIRQQQKDLYRREFLITKRLVDDNVDSEYSERKINQRLNALEKDIEIILNHIRHSSND